VRELINLIESLQVKPGVMFSQHQFLQTLANLMRRPVDWSWLKDNTYFKRVDDRLEIHSKKTEFDPITFSKASLLTLGLVSLDELETSLKRHGVKKRVKRKRNNILYR